jgi:hypothetical protein
MEMEKGAVLALMRKTSVRGWLVCKEGGMTKYQKGDISIVRFVQNAHRIMQIPIEKKGAMWIVRLCGDRLSHGLFATVCKAPAAKKNKGFLKIISKIIHPSGVMESIANNGPVFLWIAPNPMKDSAGNKYDVDKFSIIKQENIEQSIDRIIDQCNKQHGGVVRSFLALAADLRDIAPGIPCTVMSTGPIVSVERVRLLFSSCCVSWS